ncbi:MAG: hypothetical protein B1H11_04570 [Desulfobacteraceae bacterium 4484_190.1]|nr:MAG: hypothetical protein B1H11_04570 [Desulfobacteraceae bacterium 4484_190.1]
MDVKKQNQWIGKKSSYTRRSVWPCMNESTEFNKNKLNKKDNIFQEILSPKGSYYKSTYTCFPILHL